MAHRHLPHLIDATPGTISRAYKELERLGLVSSRVGDGTYVKHINECSIEEGEFRNAVTLDNCFIDLSRNKHIPSNDANFLSKALAQLAIEPEKIAKLCGYTAEEGLQSYRKAGAIWLQHSMIDANIDQVICTNGAQHALLSSLSAIVRPGEIVATEQLSYPGLITASRLLGIRLEGIEIDEDGLIPASLDAACHNNRISVLYCTPTLQNPSTSIMPTHRRDEISQICRKHNLIIIEDDAHGLLAIKRPPAIQTFAPERTLLISSLSKAVSAGLRVGYLYVPETLKNRLTDTIRASCWMATPLSHEIATHWIIDGTADRFRTTQIMEVQRRKAIVEPLLNGIKYLSKSDCSHYWIEIPEPWRAIEIEQQLKQQLVLVKSSESFAVGRRTAVPQFIRASVSSAFNDKQLVQGFNVLAAAINDAPSKDLFSYPSKLLR